MHSKQTILDTLCILFGAGSAHTLSQPLDTAHSRGSLPMETVDTQASIQEIDVGTSHRIGPPTVKSWCAIFHQGSEQDKIALVAQKLEPGDTVPIIASVVVALDGDDWDVLVFELSQSFNGVNEREGIDGTLIE